MPNPQVRYCTASDGVRIAYSVEGKGPALVVTPFLLESFLLEHLSPGHQEFMTRLAERFQVVRYDLRCTGSSQRDVPDVTFEDHVRDLEAVVRATGLKRIALFGRGVGGLAALRCAASVPKTIDRLLLYGTAARLQEAITGDALAAYAQLAAANWDTAAHALADFSGRRLYGDAGLENARWYRQSTTGKEAARLTRSMIDADATAALGRIRCPTLVLQPMDDPQWLPEYGQRIAATIPEAVFVPVQGSWHTIAFGDPEPVLRAVFDFMGVAEVVPAKRESDPALTTTLRTVLFTDIVGHTEMMQRLGDEQGRAVLREHERITREMLQMHGGVEVKTMGDGFMASFGSVTKALECAIALQRSVLSLSKDALDPGRSFAIRIGLNAGEPIEEEGDLFGSTVILASRIASQAGPGEILVPDTIRGLASGKGFLFADRGEVIPKGFEDPVRLYEVRWREESS